MSCSCTRVSTWRPSKRAAAGGGGWLDQDTPVSPRSYDVALLSVGGAIEATAAVGYGARALRARPAAGPSRHARPRHGLLPVRQRRHRRGAAPGRRLRARRQSVDWDVHHGDGTQAAFYDEPRVLFVSLHEWPATPAAASSASAARATPWGRPQSATTGRGRRMHDYAQAFDVVIEPIVRQFAPQAILVSAGQDIHRDDPIGGMCVTEAGFADMALRCVRLARGPLRPPPRLCAGGWLRPRRDGARRRGRAARRGRRDGAGSHG